MSLVELFAEVGSAILHAHLDPAPIVFKGKDEIGVAAVAAICKGAVGMPQVLAPPLTRNAFLCGCLDFTERETLEHLIVGFGKKTGSTTRMESLIHFVGEESRVSIPDDLWAAIRQFVSAQSANEVVLFHNHPATPLNKAMDNLPLASKTDRTTMLNLYSEPILALKALSGTGRVRFYVGENGFVREFCTPDFPDLMNRIFPRAQIEG